MYNSRMTNIIQKKRNGEALTRDEITYFVQAAVKSSRDQKDSDAADPSQIGAILMAIYFKDMNSEETECFTEAVKISGYVFEWPEEWKPFIVDKHSTGGVGDKVSLILAPALAALGLKVPMISGRSLGHTGGTLDKLESIPGYRVALEIDEIYDIISKVGCCIVGQTEDSVPADKILYQYREITATVQSFPLIIGSIVSKKLSVSPSSLVYDVKFGKGAQFAIPEAQQLAKQLVGASKGVKTTAYLTSMDNPLGNTIGNALEVKEAIESMQGRTPDDLLKVVCVLGSELLFLTKNIPLKEGEALISDVLKDGRALRKFCEMIQGQGVSEKTADTLCYGDIDSVLPKTDHETEIFYHGEPAFISGIDPLILANAWKEAHFSSNGHLGVGFTLLKSIGNPIKSGEAWLKVHHVEERTAPEKEELSMALSVNLKPPKREMVIEKYTSLNSD